MFFAPIYYSTNASLAPGYVATTTYVQSNDNNKTPANSLSNPYPSINQPVGNTLGLSQGLGDSLTTIDSGRRSPIVQQYSFDIQTELPKKVSLQIGYVGSKGRNLLPGNGSTYNMNQVNIASIPFGVGACPANTGNLGSAAFLDSKSANPYYNKGGIGVIAAATVANSQLCKPFPEFNSIGVQSSSSKSFYNSGILKLQKQMSQGLTFVTAITYSSNWDSSFGQGSSLNSGANGPENVYNLGGEYARAINNSPLRYTFGGTYQLPFGHGRAFLSGNRFLDLVVGGWNINSTFIAQQGGPIVVRQSTNNNSNYGTSVGRPNLVPGQSVCTSGSVQSRLGQATGATRFLNVNAFADAPAGTYGNAPRTIGSCQAPGYRNLDASIFKDFKVERVTFQFRGEFMNLTNTPQFSVPSGSLAWTAASTSFGQVSTNAINFPRLITLGGKIVF